MIRQITSTLAANIWAALIGILLVPIYVNRLGIEAYGLVGIFLTIQTLCRLFDLGIPVFINRELARLSSNTGPSPARQLVNRLEMVYWSLALLIGLGLYCVIPLGTAHWLRPAALDPETIRVSLQLIAVITVFQWPASLYIGGLIGLQKQSLLALLQSGIATGRALGAWALVEYYPSLTTFFLWQLCVTIVSSLLLRSMLRRALPDGPQGSIPWPSIVKKIYHSLPLAGIGVLSIPLLQMDKIVLSHILPLDSYGRYILASTITTSLYMITNSVYNSVFPRLTKIAALANENLLLAEYLRGTRLMGSLLLPATLCIAIFPREVLLAWTGSISDDSNASTALSLLAIGTGMHGLAHLQGALQIACGKNRISLMVNCVAVCLCVPLVWLLACSFGILGGGIYYVALHFGMLAVHVMLTHRQLLTTARYAWFKSTLVSVIAAAMVPVALRLSVSPPSTRRECFILLVLAGIGSSTTSLLSCVEFRAIATKCAVRIAARAQRK